MKISEKDWKNYIAKLRKVNEKAAEKVADYARTHDISTAEGVSALIDYSYAVATKYGEGASELACQMYDAVAEASGVSVPLAEPAATATIGETARAVRGKMFDTRDPSAIGGAVGRLVKMAGVDTTQKNALRDGAEWAWIPSGDTCAFCLTLASNGWQKASKKAIKGGHAEHIHNNCDCTYQIRFDGSLEVEGYDPDALYDDYMAAGSNRNERINALRRRHYAANKDRINAQKRAAYAARKRSYNYSKGPITANLNSPGITNADDIVNDFIMSIELPDNTIIIDKVMKSVRHMPKEDLDFISKQGVIVKETKGNSSFVRSRRSRGADGNLKYVIRINTDTDEPFVFAHECAHLSEKANKTYKDPEFQKVMGNLADNIKGFAYGEVDGKGYVTAVSDLFIEPYQGRTYITYKDFLNGKTVNLDDLVEYISSGYECYVGDPKYLENKDVELYNYFKRRGLK